MQIIVLMFLAIILFGGFLLSLPISSRTGTWTSYLSSVFTATSATCVTGLTLFDTYTHWSGFGQVVILLLIQVGGLGFMTIASMFFLLANRKIGIKQRVLMAQSLGVDQLSGIVRLVTHVLVRTAIIEGAGALILTVRFCFLVPFDRALWWGVFHSVSAFCNAGFDIVGAVDVGGSLIPFVGDWVVSLTIILLITVGGLGFFVWEDIFRHWRQPRSLSLYTKMVLLLTGALIVGGALFFLAVEWDNPATLGEMPLWKKILNGFFQSVTLRTAGFDSIGQGGLRDSSLAMSCILMLIGGSSGSTAGGLKTATVGILLLTIRATLAGRSEVTLRGRAISHSRVMDAMTLTMIVLILFLAGSMVISVADGEAFLPAAFETASAMGTVGVTTGITPGLSAFSHVFLITMMFLGRVGIMSFSVAFLARSRPAKLKYPTVEFMVG